MNRDTIDMAREAWARAGNGWVVPSWFEERAKALETFEALVRADERSIEREACALLLEENLRGCDGLASYVLQSYADSIRARGNTAQPVIKKSSVTPPDTLTNSDGETPEYVNGWNDCRQLMMEMIRKESK